MGVSGAAPQISPKGGPTGPNAHLYADGSAADGPQYQSWANPNHNGTPAISSTADPALIAQQQIQHAIAQQQLADLLGAAAIPQVLPAAEIATTQSPALAAATAGLATGHVVEWAEERGMGFIRAIEGKGVEGDVFVHRSALQDTQSLTVGQTVMYEPGWDYKKNKACTKLCFVKSQPSGCAATQSLPTSSVPLLTAPPPPAPLLPTPAISTAASTVPGNAFVAGQIATWSDEAGMGCIRSADGGEVLLYRHAVQDGGIVVEGKPCFYLPYWDPEKKKPCTKVCFVDALPADGGAAALAQQAAEETQQALAVAVGDTGAGNLAEQFGGSSFVEQWPHVQPAGPHASWQMLAGLSERFSIR